MNIDTTPEPSEIVQAEEPYDPARPIPVALCGPAEVRELPAVRAGYKTEQGVGTAIAVKLLPFEPRRKEAYICALSQDIYISGTQAGAQSGAAGAMRIPAVVPWRIGHLDEVWACAVTSTTDIGVSCDYWSE
ncbi:MAG: hypothetical protein HOV73_01820 [Streptomyces sp.]|nr:hypothetical protein [Streptomyces sp.]